MPNALFLVAAVVLAYLLGSVPFAMVSSRLFGLADPRSYGSKNPGATNVLRSGNKKAAIVTLLGDLTKGWLAVFLVQTYGSRFGLGSGAVTLVALAVFFGHLFPIFLNFRGGKGVVTTAAMMLLLDWRVFLICFAVFLLVFLKKRMVSLSSITAAAIYPVVTFCMTYFVDCCVGGLPVLYVVMATLVAALIGATVIIKHRANIKRIRNGTESTISFKKK